MSRISNIMKLLAAMMLLTSTASAFDIVRDDPATWVCVDHAVSYARDNPGWGVVSNSNHPYFLGVSHMMNYKVIDNETLQIHDGMYNADYQIANWQLDGTYYHFWIDEPIKRNYKRLFDNRELIL